MNRRGKKSGGKSSHVITIINRRDGRDLNHCDCHTFEKVEAGLCAHSKAAIKK